MHYCANSKHSVSICLNPFILADSIQLNPGVLSGDAAPQYAYYVGDTMYFHNPSVPSSSSTTMSDFSDQEACTPTVNDVSSETKNPQPIPKNFSISSIKEMLKRANVGSDSDDDEWSLIETNNNGSAGDGLDADAGKEADGKTADCRGMNVESVSQSIPLLTVQFVSTGI